MWRPWIELLRAGETRRRAENVPTAASRAQFKLRLKRLGEAGCCSASATSWVTSSKLAGRRRVRIGLSPASVDTADPGGRPAIRLQHLVALEDGAWLALWAVTDHERLDAYTVSLGGTLRETGAGWYARIDLEPPLFQQPDWDFDPSSDVPLHGQLAGGCPGAGLATHAWPHCHVGSHPDHETLKVRVPLPWLTPWSALDWLLATVHPELEPCPWELRQPKS